MVKRKEPFPRSRLGRPSLAGLRPHGVMVAVTSDHLGWLLPSVLHHLRTGEAG